MSKSLYQIEGFEQLNAKIKKLPDKVKKREILKILGQVATGTVRAARLQAPVSKKAHWQAGRRTKKLIQPGNLKRSIGKIRGKRGLGKNNAVLYVGPKTKGIKNDGWYGAFVHGGTVKQRANAYMDRAYAQTKGKVTKESEEKISKYIQKQINKLSEKGF